MGQGAKKSVAQCVHNGHTVQFFSFINTSAGPLNAEFSAATDTQTNVSQAIEGRAPWYIRLHSTR